MLIFTKYMPATNTRGSRIKATFADCASSISIPYPHELSGVDAHTMAADALLHKFTVGGRKLTVAAINNGYAFMGDTGYAPVWLGQ
jgi:hypothetical protein